MENIRISETCSFGDESIEIKCEGIPLRKNIDEEEVRRMITDFVYNHKHDNMLENVTILYTILTDYTVLSLEVKVSKATDSETVIYNNIYGSRLTEWFVFIKDSLNCKIKYDSFLGLKLNYFNEAGNIKKYTDDLSGIMKYIYALSNAKSIIINDNDKTLIEIYKLFYKENPDFSSKDINVKVQTMMSILAEFGITLDFDYAFCLWAKVKMPVSLKIEEMVHKMYPLGLVNEVKDNVKLAEEPKKIIKIVGDSIRDVIHDEDDMNEALITISKVIHASGYNLSSDANVSEIAEFTNRSVDEVEASRQLVKRIEHKINKEN